MFALWIDSKQSLVQLAHQQATWISDVLAAYGSSIGFQKFQGHVWDASHVAGETKGEDAPFHFQTLEKTRKRRLSWIPKSAGSFEGIGSGNLPGLDREMEVDTIDEEPHSGPVVAHLTREEKSLAKKEADDYREAGMFLTISVCFVRLVYSPSNHLHLTN